MTERERAKFDRDLKQIMQNTNPTSGDILKAIYNSNNIVRGDISALNDSVKKIAEDQALCSKKVQEIEQKFNTMNSDVEKLKAENEYLKQRQLINDVIVTIPITFTISSVNEFGNRVFDNYGIERNEIEQIFKKRINNPEASFYQLIIKFKSLSAKDKLFIEKKKKGPLKVHQIEPSYVNKQDEIHIRERMTAHNIELLKELNHLKASNKLSNCWFKGGTVYMRLAENDTTHRINSKADIIKFIK